MQKFWRTIWDLSEHYRIPLGRLAPYVFGKMMGQAGKRIK